jgi:hypothetical protein
VIEAFLEFVQAIMTLVASVMIFLIFQSIDLSFRVMDWWTGRNKKLDKPPDAP